MMIFRLFSTGKFHLITAVIPLSMLIALLMTNCANAQTAAQNELFEIRVTGVDDEVKENIEAILAIPNGMIRNGKIERTWARRLARQAEGRIKKAMAPFGYYEPKISVELIPHESGNFTLNVDITPGDPVRVSQKNIRISGAGRNEPKLLSMVQEFTLQQGNYLRHRLYEEGKGALLDAAISVGYLDAHFPVHELLIDPGEKKADISLELATGPQYRFGEIEFQGADAIPLEILRRYLTFESGENYSDSELAKTQSNLLSTDKFRSVQIKPMMDQSEGYVIPVMISLTPQPRFQLRPGVGYGTDTGARASLRFKNNNAFGRGHEFQSDLLIAEFQQTISGRYVVPVGKKVNSNMAVSTQYGRENNDSFETRTLSSELSLTRGFIKELNTTLFLRLFKEDFEIGSEPKQSTTLVMPGITFGQRRWRFDQPGRVRNGYAWQAEVRGSAVTLGSDVSVLQGIIGASSVVSLSEKNKLILRAESGATMQDDFNDLPPSMRFFAGGDQSVRGYAYKTLGPEDEEGNVVGGRHMLIGSMEIEHQVSKNWSLALFYDTGNAFDTFSEYELAQGAGIGIRRQTPIGPIKFDVARQLGQHDNKYRLHLSVGFGW